MIHNGSLLQHQEKVQTQFTQLKHVIMPENKGYSGGCNFALRTIFETYEWCYFLTNDISLLSLGELPKQSGLYAPRIWRRRIGVIDSLGGGFIPSEKKLFHLKEEGEIHRLAEGMLSYVPGTAFLIHREVFEKTGDMDESLHTYWEDVDFSQRVKQAGYKLDVILNFELTHKVGKTCHKDPFYTNHLFNRNKEIISLKYANPLIS